MNCRVSDRDFRWLSLRIGRSLCPWSTCRCSTPSAKLFIAGQSFGTLPKWSNTHSIHVWYIYLQLVDFMVNVGKYTIYGCYGIDTPPKCGYRLVGVECICFSNVDVASLTWHNVCFMLLYMSHVMFSHKIWGVTGYHYIYLSSKIDPQSA